MYKIHYTSSFKKDIKRIEKRNYNIKKLKDAIINLSQTGELSYKDYKTHPLKGYYKGYLDSHIQPDWIIIWRKNNNIIEIARTGSHSDLFD